MAPTQLGPCCPGGCPHPPRGCCLAASLPAAPPSPPQPWLGGRDVFWHGPSTGCPPWPRGAEGPQMLSQCSFQPAGCQLPLLPALCLSLLLLQTVGVTRGAPPPPHLSRWWDKPRISWDQPRTSRTCRGWSPPPLCSQPPTEPLRVCGSVGGGLSSFLPPSPSLLLPSCPCVPARTPLPLSPTPLPVSARGRRYLTL